MKSTGAECETKAGARRPGRAAPSGDRGPGEAGAGTVESAAAPSGVRAALAATVAPEGTAGAVAR